MSKPLFTLLDMSVSGGILILAAAALRFAFRKGPKWIPLLLWAAVGARLVLPFFPESGLGLIPRMGEVSAAAEQLRPATEAPEEPVGTDAGLPDITWLPTAHPAETEIAAPPASGRPTDAPAHTSAPADTAAPAETSVPTQAADTAVPGGTDEVPEPTEKPAPGVAASTGGGSPWIGAACAVWLCGAAAMLLYAVFGWLRLKKRLRTAVRLNEGVYCTELVKIPFIFGLVKPSVYLPFDVEGEDYKNIMTHEKAHIARADQVLKPIGFLILCVHWFNPLCWLAFALFSRDLELACDERVIKGMSMDERASYSRTVLAFSGRSRTVSAFRLSFGEAGAGERIRAVADYKKPHPLKTVAALTVIALIASVCVFCTGRRTEQPLPDDASPTAEPTSTDAPTGTALPTAPVTEFGVPLREGEDPVNYPRTEDYGVLPDEYRNIVANDLFNGAKAYRDSLVKYDLLDDACTWEFIRYDFSGGIVADCRLTLGGGRGPMAVYPTSDGGLLVTWGTNLNSGGIRVAKVVKFNKIGQAVWEYRIEDGYSDLLQYCFEYDGAYYAFGNYAGEDPADATQEELGTNWDIYMLKLGKDGGKIAEKRFGGSRCDYLYGAYVTETGFDLDLRSRSWDGDMEGVNKKGWQFEGRMSVNGGLEVTALKQRTMDFKSVSGYLDGKPVFGEGEDAIIDLGDHYLTVSRNVTGIYPYPSYLSSSIWTYVETVYTDRTKDGELIWRRAIDSTPDYAAKKDAHYPAQIIFTSAAIERAVRDRLSLQAQSGGVTISEDEGVPASAAAEITGLSLYGEDLTDLSDLAYFSGIEWLAVADAKNADFSTLPPLPKLKELTVTGCGIEDVSFVSGLTGLQNLDLSSNRIKDVTPLTALEKLETLDISNNRVEDVLPLLDLPKLEEIDASWDPVTEEQEAKLKGKNIVNHTRDRSTMACWPMDLDGDGENEYFYADLDWIVGDFVSYVWLENKDGNRLGDRLMCGSGHIAFGTYAIVETEEYGACILRIDPEFKNQDYGYELYDLADGRLKRVYSEGFYSYDDEGENKYDPAEAAEYEARLNELLKSGHILLTTDAWGVMEGELYLMDTGRSLKIDSSETMAVVCTEGSVGPGMQAMRDKHSRNLLFVDGPLGYKAKVRPFTGE